MWGGGISRDGPSLVPNKPRLGVLVYSSHPLLTQASAQLYSFSGFGLTPEAQQSALQQHCRRKVPSDLQGPGTRHARRQGTANINLQAQVLLLWKKRGEAKTGILLWLRRGGLDLHGGLSHGSRIPIVDSLGLLWCHVSHYQETTPLQLR